MLDSKNYIKKIFIAKNIGRSAGATDGAVAKANVLADGEIVVTDRAGKILTSTTVLGEPVIQIRQGRGIKTPAIKIAEINYAGLSAYTGTAYSAAVDQVSYIGYNGTSEDMEATSTDEKRFIVKITPTPNDMSFGAMPFNVKDTLFVSAASSTKYDNAIGLVKALISSYVPNRQIDFNPKIELVASDTFTAFGANTVTQIVFTKNSKIATVTVGSSGDTLASGSFLRVGGTTATTAAVYKIKTGGTFAASTSGDIELEWAYTGDSATVLAANVTEKASLAGSVGVKISGVPFRYDVNRWRQYDRMRFTVQLVNGFTTTVVTKAVAPYDGNGTWQQTMNDEYIGWGDEGQINPQQLPFLPREQDAQIDNNYSVLNIGFVNSVMDTMVATGQLKGNVIFYLNKTSAWSGSGSYNITGTTTSLVTVLDAWAAQNPAFSAQIGNL